MSCKSAIYTANNTPSSINLTAQQPAAVLPLGTIIRRFGKNVQLSGNGILLNGGGYFDVDASIMLTPVAAGNYTIALFEDGVAILGAIQIMTAGAGAIVNFNIPALVCLQCCDDSAILTLVLTTTAALPATIALNNVGVVVEKI